MKLGPVTKHDKANTPTLKKLDDDAISENCEVIVIFLSYYQFDRTKNSLTALTIQL